MEFTSLCSEDRDKEYSIKKQRAPAGMIKISFTVIHYENINIETECNKKQRAPAESKMHQ